MCYYDMSALNIQSVLANEIKPWKRIIGISTCWYSLFGGYGQRKKNGFFEFLLLHWTYSKINQKIALITELQYFRISFEIWRIALRNKEINYGMVFSFFRHQMSTVLYSILTLNVYNIFYSICLQTNLSLQTLIYQYTLFRKSQKLIIECLELTFDTADGVAVICSLITGKTYYLKWIK